MARQPNAVAVNFVRYYDEVFFTLWQPAPLTTLTEFYVRHLAPPFPPLRYSASTRLINVSVFIFFILVFNENAPFP